MKKDEIRWISKELPNGGWYPEVGFLGDDRAIPLRKISRNFSTKEALDDWMKRVKRAYHVFNSKHDLDSLEDFCNTVSEDILDKANEKLGLELEKDK